jgi:hypothetical protein
MSSRNLLSGLFAVLLIAGLGGLLLGPSDGSQVLGIGVVLIVAVSLGVFLIFRKPEEAVEDIDPSGIELVPSRSSAVVPFAIAGGALVVLALSVALFVAQGEARGHAFFHLSSGIVVLVLFTAIGLAWRIRASSGNWVMGRATLLCFLWFSGFGALMESIGAAGYDSHNEVSRIGWLTKIHSLAVPVSGLGLLLIPVGVIVLAAIVMRTLWIHWKPSM